MPRRSDRQFRTVVAFGWPGGRVRIINSLEVGRAVIGYVPREGKAGWYAFFGPNTPPAGPFGTRQAAIDHASLYI